jgi:hypothetical protein
MDSLYLKVILIIIYPSQIPALNRLFICRGNAIWQDSKPEKPGFDPAAKILRPWTWGPEICK